MSLAFDEYGRPFIILRVRSPVLMRAWVRQDTFGGVLQTDRARGVSSAGCCCISCITLIFTCDDGYVQEQGSKSRVRGTEAVKANILAAKTVARTLRSSLGPKGMDKMLQSPDGDVTISKCVCHISLLAGAATADACRCNRDSSSTAEQRRVTKFMQQLPQLPAMACKCLGAYSGSCRWQMPDSSCSCGATVNVH
jgi:hypothetical protein